MNDNLNDSELRAIYALWSWAVNEPTASKKLIANLEKALADIHESRIDKVLKWRRDNPPVVFDVIYPQR